MQSNSRVEHVVVLMLENRSFDHLMGFFPGANGLNGKEFNLLDPFSAESADNPRFTVSSDAPWKITPGDGPGHSLEATNYQQAGIKTGPDKDHPAANIGFIENYHNVLKADHIGSVTTDMLRAPMQAFTPDKLPAINTLAQEFVLCDQWYSEVPGPTQPNRLYVHAATSAGYAHNVWSHVFDVQTIYNKLQDAGCSWAVYYADDNDVAKFSQITAKAYTKPEEEAAWEQDQKNGALGAFFDFDTFFNKHAAAGTLANYVFIEPAFGDDASTKGRANSMHPPNDVRPGDVLVADVYEALRANEEIWAKTLFIVTFDEHGGLYDHVIPPAAPNPDGITSPLPGDPSWVPAFGFDRLGLRIPTILASPWLSKGKIDSTKYQHTSILVTLKNLFGLSGFLTKRDASATAFDGLLTELAEARTDTPKTLPRPALDEMPPPDDPAHPANKVPDELLQEKAAGWHAITQNLPDGKPTSPTMPETTKDAHDFMKAQVKRYANFKAANQAHYTAWLGRRGYRWRLIGGDGKVIVSSRKTFKTAEEALAAADEARKVAWHAKI